ncbi:MAG: hypothetical protein ACYSWP_08105 [Planctomycetota bacterium]|jgi:hypothetical protein
MNLATRFDKWFLVFLVVLVIGGVAFGAKKPPSIADSAAEPIRYVGSEQTDKAYFDGALRHAVGVHCYQAFRANRTKPFEPGPVGWTYNHQPYLTWWNNQFYLQYLSNLVEEHEPPGRTLVMTSKDGRNWTNPTVVFPVYPLDEIVREKEYIKAGTFSVMHQRMGFYIAPNGRLLTLAFYSFCETLKGSPNGGKGLGRVVREIYKDGSLGPIYFIRYNRHAGFNESNTRYPLYKDSKDKAFVKACEDLLADKLVSLQWWEEDRGEDGFYRIFPKKENYPPKSFSWTHRPDGTVVGIWKRGWSALTADEGMNWTEFVVSPTLKPSSAKAWIQKTEDGRYAFVYNHSATKRNRFPLTVMTSDDARDFDNLLLVNGQVPPQRYRGFHKDLGIQYIRGIIEGNGDAPGNEMWNTFSVNKEDIWVSRTKVPVTSTVDKHIDQNFEKVACESKLKLWNLYVPTWGDVAIADDPLKDGNKCLKLSDEEPHDYTVAQRAFPASKKVRVEFKVMMQQAGHASLFVEAQSGHGIRPMKLRLESTWLWMDRARTEKHPAPIEEDRWFDVRMDLNCDTQMYDLYVDGKLANGDIAFGEKCDNVERLVFRTGPYRMLVPPLIVDREPAPGNHSEDLLGSDDKSRLSIFLIDDVKTSKL